ncbi:MAG: tRNA (adenosine(37)-N6)-threonylcarbamoyltransferase complex ATPase subunit type 1 TsaE [Flavobacteriales bacterium]
MPLELKGNWTHIGLEQLEAVAKEIWELLPVNSFVALSAEMGSGKTTLIRTLLQVADIKHFEGSPTFAIVQPYSSPTKGAIFHLDCYRIETEGELLNLGLEELFDSNAYFLVEWPEKISTILPTPHFRLYIRSESEHLREITLHHDY